MKSKKLFLPLSALLLVACISTNPSSSLQESKDPSSTTSSEATTEVVTTQETTTSDATTEVTTVEVTTTSDVTTEVTTSETTTEVTTSETTTNEPISSETTSIEIQDSKKLALDMLRTGFEVSTHYSRKIGNGNPSNYYTKTSVGEEVLKYVKYTNETKEKFSGLAQYEKGEDGLVKLVSLAGDGSVAKTNLELLDAMLGEDDVIAYDDVGFVNVFTKFKDEDFTFDEGTKVVSLNFRDDEEFLGLANSLKIQLYTTIDGYSSHHFLESELESFSFTIDEANKPTTFIAKFKDEQTSDGWGGFDTTTSSLEGTFDAFNVNETLQKMVAAQETIPSFKAKMDSLKNQNYEASFKREYYDDWYGAGVDAEGTVVSDGTTGFEVTKNNKVTGYKKLSDTSYQKYEVNGETVTLSGDPVEADYKSLLPLFNICSAFFVKDETNSTAEKEVYKFVQPTEMSTAPFVSAFCGYDGAVNTSNVFVDLTITFENNSISFVNVAGMYTQTVIYTNIGGVAEINRTL